ncbi:MAG: histidine kinase, partial [Lachnospiraceae bacterium]|nr:histidine kinase [Lachnospiraceae bacterium]
MNKKRSLSKSLIITIALCWLLPVGAVTFAVNVFYYRGMTTKIDEMTKAEVSNFATIVSDRLDDAVDIAKKITYEGTLEEAYENYKWGSYTSVDFKKTVNAVLESTFDNDSRFGMVAMFLNENPDGIYHNLKGSARLKEKYTPGVAELAGEVNSTGDTEIRLATSDERLFIIRNLIDPNMFRHYGTIVLELDRKALFSSTKGLNGNDITLYINNSENYVPIHETETYEPEAKRALKDLFEANIDRESEGVMQTAGNGVLKGYMYQKNSSVYHLAVLAIADASASYAETRHMTIVFILLFLAFLPIIALVIRILKIHIEEPLSLALAGYKGIEEGDFKTSIDVDAMPNTEFETLAKSFNEMAGRLDYLFEYAYKEKLARRDAAIIALQSRINPHFLNNTLEMMNWQARMAGDAQVSKMIEALSTLLDYSMDRSNKKLIALSEEIRCADSYFYIISMRYGQRIKVEKNIRSDTLMALVPRLILQPLLENAVVHGIEKQNQGTVGL